MSRVVLPAPVPPEISRFKPPFHHGGEQFEHGLGEGVVLKHVAGGDRVASEAANGETSAVQCEGRNNGVHAGTVGEAGIDHGRRFINPPAHAGNDALDDLHQVLIVFEGQIFHQLQLASSLDVDPVEAVYQDVRDGVVLEQGFERTQAEDFVENFPRQPLALGEAEGNDFAVYRVADEDENFLAGGVAGGAAEFLEVKAVEDLAMQIRLYLLVFAVLEGLQIGHNV